MGLAKGTRRRTPGLRREEVAQLASISTDYYERLEQARGVNPSEQVVASLARALRLSTDERDHLYVLAGYQPPPQFATNGYIDPGLMHLLDALTTIPAQITDDLLTVMVQNPLAVALFGAVDRQPGLGLQRRVALVHRPGVPLDVPRGRTRDPSRIYAADLRYAVFRRDDDKTAQSLVTDLLARSSEFTRIWELGEVASMRSCLKKMRHPHAGPLEIQCDVVLSPGTGHRLVMFRPQPGTETAEKIDFLRVLGTRRWPSFCSAVCAYHGSI